MVHHLLILIQIRRIIHKNFLEDVDVAALGEEGGDFLILHTLITVIITILISFSAMKTTAPLFIEILRTWRNLTVPMKNISKALLKVIDLLKKLDLPIDHTDIILMKYQFFIGEFDHHNTHD